MNNPPDHRHTWQIIGSFSGFMLVIEDWLGPTAGLLNCDLCHAHALAHLLAWRGEHCEWRIFGVRALNPEVVDTYQNNINRDYCDLSRKQSETQALFATASPLGLLMEVNMNLGMVTRVSAEAHQLTPVNWQSITELDFAKWSPLMSD